MTTTAAAAPIPKTLVERLQRRQELVHVIRALTAEKEATDAACKAFLGERDATVGTFRGAVVVQLQDRSRMDVDVRKLRESEPEVAERYARLLTWTEVRVA
jgi:hypothetical protein